ncbi:NADP-dependent oxidoreductase domain-containing protein [Roridomyces roridus]|uniref:NADP-dependent oxidoreductase domain-containing protein n=1 Tax=Roridomyces roridus TaxID=1738132 RepID=A0AAD7BN49_9AGAR|nr:NADP-dependent oxidoreductase domain-containing protein [Roridomyces roridus]
MTSARHETFDLGPFKGVPRSWCGLWQLSSNAWGSAPVPRIRRCMGEHVQLGFTAFDMADHYGSAEIIFGQFRRTLPSPGSVLGATKWCAFKPVTPSRAVVEAAVRERMHRMQTDRVDLLQFHWQDYADKGYLTALEVLNDLRTEGLITAIGLCNFDTIRTDEICTQLGRGVIVSNQVQFSLIDTRPLHGMTDVCARHGVKLLTYGTLCGGFLADRWLDQPEPDLYSGTLTPSQRKYLDMIVKAWGTWALFQTLLRTLRAIADRHNNQNQNRQGQVRRQHGPGHQQHNHINGINGINGIGVNGINGADAETEEEEDEMLMMEEEVDIANIATRWVLDQESVGAVILGQRLGLSSHLASNLSTYACQLTAEDHAAIEDVLMRSRGREMITSVGDCGAEYR